MAALPRKQDLIMVLTGAIAALGQAPVGLWPATIFGLAYGVMAFRQTTLAFPAARVGWFLGFGYFALSLSWIVEPFLVDVARHGWMGPFALLFLAGGLALFWAAAFWCARRIGGSVAALIACLTLAEAARGTVFSGFPWALIGHVWIDSWMVHWAAVGGALGLTGLVLLGAVGLGILRETPLLGAGLLGLVAAFFIGGQALRDAPQDLDGRPVVRLIQPNAPQHEKWDPDKIQMFFDRQVAFTAALGTAGRQPDLIVWPETAVPVWLDQAEETLNHISQAAGRQPVVLGIQSARAQRIYNSLVLLGDKGEVISKYDKHHLVPFGEYMPFGQFLSRFGIRGLAAEEGSGYSAGPGPEVIEIDGIGTALPLICYEGVFARDVATAPARADLLLLITNDAWFGQVSGPYQHLAQARLRAVEQGVPMIRVANTGISAVIDPDGRVLGALDLGEAGWRDLPIPRAKKATFYSRTGDPLVILVALLAVMAAGFAARRK